MLQKVEAMSTFWDVKMCFVRRWLHLLQAARSDHEKRARGPRAWVLLKEQNVDS